MEDGVKDGKAQPAETTSVSKAGWLKKSSGRFLGSYKDRYISVERTEIVVYENEDLEKCIERVDLEKYDKCCASRGAFQKKNRLVLIPAPKSKVHEVKLQVTDPGQKDAWLAAISDAINRAKNKIFDEVKVDESCSLEHVTRTRPKGNRTRRPPTRIHMKEVANTSSDGILRLDLDAVEAMPNGTCEVKAETEAPKEAIKPPMPPSKPSEAALQNSGEEDGTQTSAIKPPMPPSSDSKPKEALPQGSGEEDGQQKLAIKPPLPPSSDSKPKEALPQGSGEEDGQQKSAIKPPLPPSSDSKPKEALPQGSGEEDGQQKLAIKPPLPPSSDSKPKEALPQGSGEEDGQQKSAIKPPLPPSSDSKPKEALPQGSGEEDGQQKSAIKLPLPPSSDSKPKEALPQGSGEEDGPQKSAIKPPLPPSSDSKPKEALPQGSGEEDGPQKSAIKPPLPPSSDSKPKEDLPQGSGEEDGSQKSAIKLPMPPSSDSKSKEALPQGSGEEDGKQKLEPADEPTDDNCGSEIECVPSSSPADMTSTSSEKAESDETPFAVDPSPPSKDLQPPIPPSKNKKPILKPEDAVPEQPLSMEGNKDERPVEPTSEDHPSTSPEEAASGKDTTSSAEATVTSSEEADKEDLVPAAIEPEPTNLTAISVEKQELVTSSSVMNEEGEPKVADPEPCASNTKPPEQTPERVKKGPAPPAPPKKKPLKAPHVIAGQCNVKASPANVPSVESANQTLITPVETVSMETNLEEISCSTDTNSVILPTISSMEAENVSVNIKSTVPDGEIVPSTIIIAESKEDPPKVDDEVSLEPKKDVVVIVLSSYDSGENLNLSLEKIDRDEMRSSDSGQHSDEEMESGDNIRASTIALSGSRTRLDEEICEDSTDSMDNHSPPFLSGNAENLHDIMKGALIPELSETCSPVTRKCLSVGDLLSTSQPGPQPFVRDDAHMLQGKASPDPTATGEPFDKVSEGKRQMSTSALKPAEQAQLNEALKRHQKARILKVHTTRRQSW